MVDFELSGGGIFIFVVMQLECYISFEVQVAYPAPRQQKWVVSPRLVPYKCSVTDCGHVRRSFPAGPRPSAQFIVANVRDPFELETMEGLADHMSFTQ